MLLTRIDIHIENDLPADKLEKVSEMVHDLAEYFIDNALEKVKEEHGKNLVFTVTQ